MNNNMMAAAVVWAAEEELKADGRKYKRALVAYAKTAIDTIKGIDDKEFGTTLQRLGIGADDGVEDLNRLTSAMKNIETSQLIP